MTVDPHAILRSKAPHLTREFIDGLSTRDAWKLVYTLPKISKPKVVKLTVCFTGFAGDEAAPLRALAEKNGYTVVQSVVNDLTILCTGATPGPVKLSKAGEQGSRILSAAEFKREMNV
jgi:DNA ligase (NAD+)